MLVEGGFSQIQSQISLHFLNWLDNISALKIPASKCIHHSTHCQANEEAIKAIDSDLTYPVRFTLYWNLYVEYQCLFRISSMLLLVVQAMKIHKNYNVMQKVIEGVKEK